MRKMALQQTPTLWVLLAWSALCDAAPTTTTPGDLCASVTCTQPNSSCKVTSGIAVCGCNDGFIWAASGCVKADVSSLAPAAPAAPSDSAAAQPSSSPAPSSSVATTPSSPSSVAVTPSSSSSATANPSSPSSAADNPASPSSVALTPASPSSVAAIPSSPSAVAVTPSSPSSVAGTPSSSFSVVATPSSPSGAATTVPSHPAPPPTSTQEAAATLDPYVCVSPCLGAGVCIQNECVCNNPNTWNLMGVCETPKPTTTTTTTTTVTPPPPSSTTAVSSTTTTTTPSFTVAAGTGPAITTSAAPKEECTYKGVVGKCGPHSTCVAITPNTSRCQCVNGYKLDSMDACVPAPVVTSAPADPVSTVATGMQAAQPGNSDGLSTPALIGIIAGGVAGVLIIAFVLFIMMRRRKNKDTDDYHFNSAVSMTSAETSQPPPKGNGQPPSTLFFASSNANPIYVNQPVINKPSPSPSRSTTTTHTAQPGGSPTVTEKRNNQQTEKDTMFESLTSFIPISFSRHGSKEGRFSRTNTCQPSIRSVHSAHEQQDEEPLYDNFDYMKSHTVAPQQTNLTLAKTPSYHAEIPTPSPLTLQSFSEHLFFGTMTSYQSQGLSMISSQSMGADVTDANKVSEAVQKPGQSTLTRPDSTASNGSCVYVNCNGEEGNTTVRRRSSYMSRDRFVKLRQLGESERSAVFQGVLQDGGQFANIAIRELKMTTAVDARTFRAEARTLIGLRHPNVLAILGCTDTQPLSLVMEYAALGDLGSYLRDNDQWGSRKTQRSKVTLGERLWYSYQIARGMAYLAHRGIVHPDLRAKNCLLAEPATNSYGYPVIKIGGFGLAQCNPLDQEVYLMKSKGKMPFEWMGPEALKSLQMTVESSVWAYGVTLWEIFSDGARPYAGSYGSVESWVNLITDLGAGYRLPKLKTCDSDTHALMVDCWEADPTKRPTFQTVASRAADTFIPHCPAHVTKQVTEADVVLVDSMGSPHPTSPLSQAPSGYFFTGPNAQNTAATPGQGAPRVIYENMDTIAKSQSAKLA
eukprot:comp24251_c2_seq1/m.44916 comp24251_c2_seq1/g.44916  ORF comp24251_c2_seq1/g.44916 comp24251_c2_seq1/m.44916 type:complete len:1030 (-) comp24251_c2_seq1:165-3254(-)